MFEFELFDGKNDLIELLSTAEYLPYITNKTLKEVIKDLVKQYRRIKSRINR